MAMCCLPRTYKLFKRNITCCFQSTCNFYLSFFRKVLSEYHLKMAMTLLQRHTLTKTLEVLTEDLDVIPAIIHLKSKAILTDADEEKIIAKVTEKEKVMEFLKIIKKRGEEAYCIFHEYLKNCPGSEHLAEELDTNLKEVIENVAIWHCEFDVLC